MMVRSLAGRDKKGVRENKLARDVSNTAVCCSIDLGILSRMSSYRCSCGMFNMYFMVGVKVRGSD